MNPHFQPSRHPSPHELHQGEAVAERYRNAWLSEATTAVVLVLKDLSVVWANRVARQLQSDGLISLEGGFLSIRDQDTTARLRTFVQDIASAPAAWVAHPTADGYMVVRGEAMEPAGWPLGVALTFRMTAAPDSYVLWGDLREVLGLTKTEVVIVKRLLAGDRAEDIAADTPVTLETVRTHIRRIYIKLNVGTREQLFAKIIPFRVG